MLSLLHIENIAVIECADISFDRGFNVLTGETGAGKSIVIDAISAILGERAYRDMIRTGTSKASVRAVFTDVPELAWFSDNGVEYDSETVIQREIYLDGKNICRVNGCLVSVSILRKLGIQLINIHGQHDSASLFDEDNHLTLLDAFAGNDAFRTDYAEKYEVVSKLRREIDRISIDESEKLRRMETLRFQINEIEKAELEAGEDEELEARRKILQNAEKLSDGMEEAVECLYGGDDSDGAAGLLAQAEHALARLSRFTDAYAAIHEKIADLMYQVQDAAEEVRDARDDLSYSADELETIEARLDKIYRLRRKYGVTCADILDYLDKAKKELDEIEFADDHVEHLKKKLKKAEKEAWDAAKTLRQNRKDTAISMSQRILTELAQLDMPRVQFEVQFTELDLTATGADSVAFYMESKIHTMKKLFITISAALISMGAYAQDAQQVAADAAQAVNDAPAAETKAPKPSNWTNSLKTNINVGQTGLFNWAAGGDNTVSVAAFVDGNANWKKGDMFWNNRLQLDYGFLYASSKPILQKSTDRIYLESKWGYKTEKMKNFYFSANFDFKSQFTSGWDYNTPASLVDGEGNKLTVHL